MNEQIKSDLYRYVPKPYSLITLLNGFRSQGFRFMFFYRLKQQVSKNNPLWLVYKLFIRHYMLKYGFQIGGKIGYGFYIGHFGTIVVNPKATIGDNCNIAHNVTIGVTNRGQKAGVPSIGNEVWIGTGSVIVGKITIGNNVLIAPGAYVNFDVPDNSIVMGNPGKISSSEFATSGYINNKFIKK